MARKVKPRVDLYAELGVDRGADAKTVHRAYRRRSREAHPDAGGSAEAFERLQLAHMVLTDQRRRSEYDRTGECDEPGPDPTESAAMGIIAHILQTISNNEELDVFAFDLSEVLREQIRDLLKGHRGALRQISRARRRAEKIGQRFIRKHGEANRIAPMMTDYAGKLKWLEEQRQLSVDSHSRALDILDGYSFQPDEPAPKPAPKQNPLYMGTFIIGDGV